MIRFNVKRETPIEMAVTDVTLLKGDDGKSAYEIAVEHGFEGTDEAWLESLRVKGDDGKSAYQIAVEHGFEGGEDEWLESLKVKGDDGKSAYQIAVEHGFNGTEGEWLESLKQEDQLPVYSADNEGQFLRITSGVPTWSKVPTAEEESF